LLTTSTQDNGTFSCTNYYWEIDTSNSQNNGFFIFDFNLTAAMSTELIYKTGSDKISVTSNYPGSTVYSSLHHITHDFSCNYYTHVGILWQKGGKTTAQAPAFAQYPNADPITGMFPTVINDRQHAMCLTSNDQKTQDSVARYANEVYTLNKNLTIYDQFGNSGYFNFTVSDWENPVLNNNHV